MLCNFDCGLFWGYLLRTEFGLENIIHSGLEPDMGGVFAILKHCPGKNVFKYNSNTIIIINLPWLMSMCGYLIKHANCNPRPYM